MKKKFTLLLLLLLAGITANADPIQINTQEDFDNWVAGIKDGSIPVDADVELNTNITVVGTNCIIENYKGVFEGNYHTIDLQLNRQESDQGLAIIRDLDGTFQNAYITGTIEGNGQFFASVAQDLNDGSLVKNVHSSVNFISHINGDGTHGGIAARCEGAATLKNIIYSGKMFNPEGGTHSCGGLVGWVNIKSSFENCLMIGDISEIRDNECNTIGRHQESIDGKNIFASMFKNQAPASCVLVTPEELASGQVCFALNGKQEEITWWQTIGVDAAPTFDNRDGSHKQVFAVGDIRCDGKLMGEATYNNESGTEIPEHSYEDGVCVDCGQFQPGFLTEEDGWYIITTAEQLAYVANLASANPTINIKIAADIDMDGVEYTPITGGYSGTFDGQHHTISNLVIHNPADNQALIGVAGTCTVKNLTLDSSCSISGAAYCAGFVGQTNGAVTLTMEGLFMHGDVTGTGANIGAIHGCNMSNQATIIMTNCGMSGTIVGARESGLISGYFGTDKITLNGVWATGTVTGSDNDTDAVFGRPNFGVTYTNCWSVKGNHSSIGTISADAAETGELAWKLNGEDFTNIIWFQNLDEGDIFPGLDSSRGVVYPTVEGYETFFPDDPESFAPFKMGFVGVAQAYLASEDVNTYGGTVLVEEYAAVVAGYETANTLEEFVPVHEADKAKKAEVEVSVAAYKNYEAVITEIIAELERRDDFSGPARDFLEKKYIDGGLQPGEDERAPNGSSDYILENRLLPASEVDKEATYARELFRMAMLGGYDAGTEITDLMVNANFADGFSGWKGTVFTGHSADTREGSTMHSAEIWGSGAHDMYQEIVASKAGVYELQVRGGYRPFNEEMSIQYYPYIYLNGNANYLQTVIEDYIPVEEAVDGENCNLDPDQVPDRPITNEQGETIGWALHGTQSCNVAFTAGRYDNRILINVNEGDVLRIGIKHPYSEFGGDEWVGIGDIHLTYRGELEEAGEALDRVLESMLARANTLLGIGYKTDEDYVKYPNYSQALKDQVAACIEKAAGAADAAAKYGIIEELSAAFVEIIDCKKAYMNFFAEAEKTYSLGFKVAEMDPSYAEICAQIEAAFNEGIAAYEAGSMTTEEAKTNNIFNSVDIFPTIDENGVYHIANTVQYASFAALSNSSNGQAYNVVLDADVSMDNDMVINDFYGTFDGQDHTLTVNIIEPGADNAAPITNLRGATVKNLIVKGTITTSHKYAAGIAAHSYETNGRGSTLDRIQSWVDITANIGGDATHGGILAVNDSGTDHITNSFFAGSISGTGHSNGGIVGYSTVGANVENCLVTANITASTSEGNIIGRNKTVAKNCYYVTPYGSTPDGATRITEEQLASGEVTYGLNGGNSGEDAVWRQDLGTDAIPTLDPNHKIVYLTEDGTYTNATPDGIQSVTDKKDNAKSRIYNINGIRVEKTKKGLYIIDGKKVMVK